MTLSGKRILLVIGGGIAAYKSLDLIRRLRERGAAVRCVMTAAAQQFVTQLSVGALSADHVFADLFDIVGGVAFRTRLGGALDHPFHVIEAEQQRAGKKRYACHGRTPKQ